MNTQAQTVPVDIFRRVTDCRLISGADDCAWVRGYVQAVCSRPGHLTFHCLDNRLQWCRAHNLRVCSTQCRELSLADAHRRRIPRRWNVIC